jgi:magnesium-transporting ATPase (P-type)
VEWHKARRQIIFFQYHNTKNNQHQKTNTKILKMEEIIEMLYPDQGQLSESMYNYGLYSTMFLIALLIGLVGTVLFYYIINSPRFNRNIHWFLVMLGCVLVNVLVVFQYPSEVIAKDSNVNYTFQEWLVYGLVHCAWSAILFVLLSLGLKWWSRNCKTTPF